MLHFCRLYCLTKIIKTLIKILKPHDIVTQATFKLVICNTVLTKYNLTKLKDSAPAPLYQPILHVQLLTKLKKKFLFLFFMSIHFGVLVCLEQLCIFRLLHCMLGKFIKADPSILIEVHFLKESICIKPVHVESFM